ncbi:hypothetical protein PtA15_18A450 [Puccinia triticina]|uniref:Nucleoside transporter n=1 Tax=Puccinia triticina TaxID=208348 RepID=A0ABY7D6U9_9BASI|nr:uncharacterized protein PtA15_18A450 [Puccinia triticina]WAQ93389.1 hypothetical protein PtA15_18A450 [Puccinia triticina]WAR63388.1 hypothetical protein PtB15_18B474 [Puccinia triticina]
MSARSTQTSAGTTDGIHGSPSIDFTHESTTLYEPEADRRVHQQQPDTEHESYAARLKAPDKSQELLAYLVFFILGSSFLLPWNSMLVSTTYFGSRLAGHRFQFNYMNWITVVFTIANVVFISRATSTQQNNKNPTIRITMSLLLITSLSIILLISTRYIVFDPSWFFGFLIAVTLAEALGSSYLQTSVIGLSAWFGSTYLQAILSGQGAIGVLVSMVQLLVNIKELDSGPSNPGDTAGHIRQSSYTFYGLCTGFSILALLCFLVLLKLPIYKLAIERKHSARNSHQDSRREDSVEQPLLSPSVDLLSESFTPLPTGPDLLVVERKIRLLGFSIFYNFFITLAVFPSITGFILSSNDPDRAHIGALAITSNSSRFLNNWYKPTIFIPLHFVIFNLGDWTGRVLPQLFAGFSQRLVKKKTALYTLSAMRTVFIPLFLVCNVDYSSIILLRSDLIYLLILTCFSISNGYLSALIMTAGVLEPTLKPNEVDVAATCLSFYLTSGLAAGSLISFGVKAIVFIL